MVASDCLLRCSAHSMPKAMERDKIELPPYEIKGKVMPVTGINPIFIPVLIKICPNIKANKPNE